MMVEFCLVYERREVDYYGEGNVFSDGLVKDGKRKVFRSKSVEEVRDKVKYFIDKRWLVEFIGLGWRCVFEDGRYWWSKVRDLEEYVDDLEVDW